MVTLWKRATPSQYYMLRAIAGAVRNAAHAHAMELPLSFARSVAKRATGTLTAQWPDVLAAKLSRQIELRDGRLSRSLRGSKPAKSTRGERLAVRRRSPIRAAWEHYKEDMWRVKHTSPELYASRIRVLQLLDAAQRELDSQGEDHGQSMGSQPVASHVPVKGTNPDAGAC